MVRKNFRAEFLRSERFWELRRTAKLLQAWPAPRPWALVGRLIAAKAPIATDRGFKYPRLLGSKRPWSSPPALGQAKARKRGRRFGDWQTRRAMDAQSADSGSTCW